jgi:hypothetical protein
VSGKSKHLTSHASTRTQCIIIPPEKCPTRPSGLAKQLKARKADPSFRHIVLVLPLHSNFCTGVLKLVINAMTGGWKGTLKTCPVINGDMTMKSVPQASNYFPTHGPSLRHLRTSSCSKSSQLRPQKPSPRSSRSKTHPSTLHDPIDHARAHSSRAGALKRGKHAPQHDISDATLRSSGR